MNDSAPVTFSFSFSPRPKPKGPRYSYSGVRGGSSLLSYTWLESPSLTSPEVCVGECKLYQIVYED